MRWLAPLFVFALVPLVLQGSSESFVGTLTDPIDVFETTFTLAAPTAGITLQTYGFGGGTNAAGTVIASGGTDPFLAIFSGTGAGATMLTDASSNPFGTSLDLTNYSSFQGCPPAGTVDIGGAVCGDITMALPSLDAGTYTVILSDGQYIPFAVFDNGMLGEGFVDLTGAQFCNLSINGLSCPNDSGNYALDITGLPASAAPVPEPTDVGLSLPVAFVIAGALRRAGRFRRSIWPTCKHPQGANQ
ncbi:MAG TPA: DVUA0089 family protein [Bryobacteraceae bacterium]|nr:DVUA0089 family protein [Bryobacteraceae bacterium]